MGSWRLPGTLDSLDDIRRTIERETAGTALSQEDIYKLMLAADELATNIVIHGYQEHGLTGEIGLTIERRGEELIVILEDTGPKFDPHTLMTPPNLDRPLEEREIGGLGVYLALASLDRFDYEWLGTGNRNIMVMRLNDGVPAKEG